MNPTPRTSGPGAMRIVALVAVVALLVAGGFWLARGRGATPAVGGPSTPGTSETETSDASTPPSAPDADTPADDAGRPDAADEGAQEDPAPDAAASDAADTPADAAAEAEPAQEDAAAEDGLVSVAPVAPVSDAELAALLPVGFSAVEYVTTEPRRMFESADEVLTPGLDYVALLHTNRGDIVVDLYEDRTPVTVNNFVFLSLHRFYQGVPFHRVLEDFMAQTGDPTGTGSGGPGFQFQDEIVDGLSFDAVGQLAMANAGPGTNGSQFFITFAATPWLTGAHTIFGEVMSGVEVLDTITRVDPASPSAIVMPTDTLADLAAKGIDLPGAPDTTIEQALETLLGTSPVLGQSFTAAGYRGVMGQLGADPAYGFFPQPDTLLQVVIGTRPTE